MHDKEHSICGFRPSTPARRLTDGDTSETSPSLALSRTSGPLAGPVKTLTMRKKKRWIIQGALLWCLSATGFARWERPLDFGKLASSDWYVRRQFNFLNDQPYGRTRIFLQCALDYVHAFMLNVHRVNEEYDYVKNQGKIVSASKDSIYTKIIWHIHTYVHLFKYTHTRHTRRIQSVCMN